MPSEKSANRSSMKDAGDGIDHRKSRYDDKLLGEKLGVNWTKEYYSALCTDIFCIKARVQWVDLSQVRLSWRVLSATVNRLSDGRELTVSAGRLAKSPCPRTPDGRLTYVQKKTRLSGHGPLLSYCCNNKIEFSFQCRHNTVCTHTIGF